MFRSRKTPSSPHLAAHHVTPASPTPARKLSSDCNPFVMFPHYRKPPALPYYPTREARPVFHTAGGPAASPPEGKARCRCPGWRLAVGTRSGRKPCTGRMDTARIAGTDGLRWWPGHGNPSKAHRLRSTSPVSAMLAFRDGSKRITSRYNRPSRSLSASRRTLAG